MKKEGEGAQTLLLSIKLYGKNDACICYRIPFPSACFQTLLGDMTMAALAAIQAAPHQAIKMENKK